MTGMTNFNESDHPRGGHKNPGTFTEKGHSAPEAALEPSTEPAPWKPGFIRHSGTFSIVRITEEEAEQRWEAGEKITYDQASDSKTSYALLSKDPQDGIALDEFYDKHADWNSRARANQRTIYYYRESKRPRKS